MVELITVDKEENKKINYPTCIRTEGIAPSQYGTKGLIDSRLAEVEEKYDLTQVGEGFGEKNEDGEDLGLSDDTAAEAGEEAGEAGEEEV